MNELEELKSKIEELEKENNKLEKDKAYWEDKAYEFENNLNDEEAENNRLRKELEKTMELMGDFIYDYKLIAKL